jgi:DNA-binding transcriptional LysR family regulator
MVSMGGALQDLNDLYFFAAVVEQGGFSAAGRALGVPKSRLSKRIAQLEERLGVRLLQRTTRRFVVTEVGERFYGHCRAVLEEAQAAQDAVDELRTEPRGTVRVSCPVSLVQSLLGPILPEFLAMYPKVQVRLLSSNRRVDIIGESFDVAIRVRDKLDTDATMVLRSFGGSRALLVASPGFLARADRPSKPADLARFDALSMSEQDGAQVWDLVDAGGRRESVEVQPRLVTGDFNALLDAALQGTGIALLPEEFCGEGIASGKLEWVLPDWTTAEGILHFLYPSRRGLLPAVRAFVDFLAERLPPTRAARLEKCKEAGRATMPV